MEYLLNRNGRYYYSRRVPSEFREYDKRDWVRFALKTSDKIKARKLAFYENEKIEKQWQGRKALSQNSHQANFESTLLNASFLGLPYVQADNIPQLPFESRLERLLKVLEYQYAQAPVEAILGGVKLPAINLEKALAKYWDFSKDKIINKSEHQKRKWRLPRERAIKNFVAVVGNVPVTEIIRDDILKFRDWWLARIEKGLTANTANKDFIHLKVVLEVVSDNLKLNLDLTHLFRKIAIEETEDSKRLPLETDYIRNILLNPENLKGLNHEAFWALHAIAETGAGISEQCCLMPEDIVLDHEIPHIIIQPRAKRLLKTKYRKRIIPLVGYALDAFKACPNGFAKYTDKPDSLSNVLNKYLRDNNLLPSKQHSVYSLRHSFQDRILSVNAPDRIQADLMGHLFDRPEYGNGGTLKQKQDWMKKVKLKK